MSGELNYFRKRFFGGFNRQDVVDYITKLSQERNELRAMRDTAVRQVKELADEAASLRLALEEAKQEANKNRTEAIEAAIRTFSDLESDFTNLRKDIETAASGVRAELQAASGRIAEVPLVLERAEERVAELRAFLDAEKVAVTGDDNNSDIYLEGDD